MHKLYWQNLRWLIVAILIFVVDIYLKSWVNENMLYGWLGRIEISPFFNLLHVHNYGAAFSFLSDQNGWQRLFFIIVTLCICAVLTYWLMNKDNKAHLNLSYVFILGGAIGNLYDRIHYGYVIDYLDFYWGEHHWPTFNLADITICLGVGILLIDSFFEDKKTSTTTENNNDHNKL